VTSVTRAGSGAARFFVPCKKRLFALLKRVPDFIRGRAHRDQTFLRTRPCACKHKKSGRPPLWKAAQKSKPAFQGAAATRPAV